MLKKTTESQKQILFHIESNINERKEKHDSEYTITRQRYQRADSVNTQLQGRDIR